MRSTEPYLITLKVGGSGTPELRTMVSRAVITSLRAPLLLCIAFHNGEELVMSFDPHSPF
jgi:hypothetical protein